ncbi:MAG: ABC transporter substrate-binding protein [Bryobacteraceae bacterium]
MRPLILLLLVCGVAFAAPPVRIISTAPSITETLFALGLGDRVIGVSNYCHYPQEATARPKVGSYLRPNVETIVALKPDLVILQKIPNGSAEQLERMDIRALVVEHGNLAGMFAAIRAIGGATGVSPKAEALIREMDAQLGRIRARTRNLSRRSLLFVVGRAPGRLEGLIAVGKGSYLNELMDAAGGQNALADSISEYPRISLETVLARNPDVVVDMGDMADTTSVTESHKQAVVALWSQRPSLKAVAGKRVFAVASDIFVVPGPRVAEAALAFARMLHPEAGL